RHIRIYPYRYDASLQVEGDAERMGVLKREALGHAGVYRSDVELPLHHMEHSLRICGESRLCGQFAMHPACCRDLPDNKAPSGALCTGACLYSRGAYPDTGHL